METPQKPLIDESPPLNSVERVDLTHLSLAELQDHLSVLLSGGEPNQHTGGPTKQRYILHGSSTAGLTTFEPRYSYNGIKQQGMTAIFATDQPVVVAVRGIGGSHIVEWAQASLFAVDCGINQLPPVGYIYAFSREDFQQNPLDLAEYYRTSPVNAALAISVSQ